eukprot:5957652-Pyramimonas_sp.AAC.1
MSIDNKSLRFTGPPILRVKARVHSIPQRPSLYPAPLAPTPPACRYNPPALSASSTRPLHFLRPWCNQWGASNPASGPVKSPRCP